jgi:hypothetical protein
MAQYDNRGKVSLWNAQKHSDKSPSLMGSVIAHRDIFEGEALDLALWENHSENPKAPAMTGKLKDKEPTHKASRAETSPPPIKDETPPDDFDDDIPF